MIDFTVQHNKALEFMDSLPKGYFANKVVLDLGCGDGFGAFQMKGRGAKEVIAVDPHPHLPDTNSDGVRYNKALEGSGISLHTSLDEVGKVEIIWCHHVLEHVPNPVSFLEETRKHLRRLGILLLTVPNMEGVDTYSLGHVNSYIAPQLLEVLRTAGYGVEQISIWAKGGQLRVRVPCCGGTEYPPEMWKHIVQTGRCPASALRHVNWDRIDVTSTYE